MRLLELAIGSIMLRHDEPACELGRRHVMYGVHHRGRDENGDYTAGGEPAIGDVVGSVLWPAEAGRRPLPALSFAMPVVVARPPGDGRTQIRNEPTPGGAGGVRPIFDARLNADGRIAEQVPAYPSWASKLPKGWTGIVAAATLEDGPAVPVMAPAALGVVAPGHAGDGELSTAILDLDDQNRPDPERRALAGTVWDVVKGPSGGGFGRGNPIAWRWAPGRTGTGTRGAILDAGSANQSGAPADNEGTSEREATGDGRTNARPNGTTNKAPLPQGPPPITIGEVHGSDGGQVANVAQQPSGTARIGLMTVFEGGPVALGDSNDQHQIGVDQDGRAIGPAHISTLALVHGNGGDGPIAFEAGPWPQLQPGNFLTPAHIRFNPAASHVWGPGRTGDGVWGVFAEGYFYVPDPPKTPTPPEGPPPTGPRTPPTPPPRDPPRRPPTPTPGGGGDVPPGGGGVTGGGGGGGRLDPPPTGPTPTPQEPGQEQPEDPDAVDEHGHARTREEIERAKREREERERQKRENPPPPPGKPSGGVVGPDGEILPNPPPIPEGGRLHPVDDPARPGDSQPFPPFPGAPVDPGRRQRPQDGDEMEGERRREEEDRRRFVTGTRYDDARPLVASPTEIAVPGIVIRPQHFGCGRPDLRNQVRSRAEDVAQHDAAAPAVMRTEGAFARAGDTCNAGDPTFTHRKGRYRVGTASGTVADFPAEVGFEDASVSYSPGFALSTVYRVGLAGSLHYGTGLPDPMGGAPKSGQMWGQVTAGGALVFRSTTSAGAVSKTRTLPEADGTIALVETSPLKGIRFSNGTVLRSFSVVDATLEQLADLVYTACYDLATTGELTGYTIEDRVGTYEIDCESYTLYEMADLVATVIDLYQSSGYLQASDYGITNRRTRFALDCDDFTMNQLAYVVTAMLGAMGV